MNRVEKELKEIQEDIYGDETDFAILCPYCNYEFVMEGLELKEEIECPECENVIELDWGNEEKEEHSCGGCGGGGGCCHGDDQDDM